MNFHIIFFGDFYAEMSHFRDNEILLIFCFVKNLFVMDPDSWIRIFLRIEIQEAKMLRIQQIRIRILSVKCVYCLYWDWDFSHFHKIIRQNKYITFKTEKPRLRNLQKIYFLRPLIKLLPRYLVGSKIGLDGGGLVCLVYPVWFWNLST